MWKKFVERGRRQMTIWRMRIVCRVTKARDTHSEHVILIAFPLQQWLRLRVSLICYSYIACLVHAFVFGITISRCLEGANQLSIGHTASLFTVEETFLFNCQTKQKSYPRTQNGYTLMRTHKKLCR